MLNLRQFEIFRAVMSHQSTVGAARDLLISQPAVSNAIRHLEDQLGFALFDRTGNRLVPREEARVLYRESEAIFLLSRALNQTVDDLKDNRRGRVRVVATPQLGHTIVPSAVREFLRRRPKVKVTIDIAQSYSVVESVEVAAADFGLAIALEKELSQTFEMVPLATMPLVCIVPVRHPLAKTKVIRPKDLRGQTLIGLEMGSRLGPLIRDAFRAEATSTAIWHILALSVFQGVINSFDMPARQVLLREMIERKEDLPNAIALNSSLVNGARLVGPSVAGVLIALTSEAWCFVVDSISYVAVVLALLAMRLPSRERQPETTPLWRRLHRAPRAPHTRACPPTCVRSPARIRDSRRSPSARFARPRRA